MKCGACCTENPNEATFCRSCGRNLRDTYITNTSKRGILFIPIFMCLVVFVASCILCTLSVKKLFEKRSLSGSFAPVKTSSFTYYIDEENAAYAYYVGADKEEGHKKTRLYKGKKYELVEEGVDCSLIKRNKTYCFVTNGKCIELNGLQNYMLCPTMNKLVFLTTGGELYEIKSGERAIIDYNVLQFTIPANGNYVAYLRNDISGTSDGVYMDKNAFYIDKKEASIESDSAKCASILCANELGFYYVTESSDLRLVVRESKDEKNTFPGANKFSHLIAVGSKSILYAAQDGKTYLWNGTDEEKLFSKETLNSIILPSGFMFTGDDYNNLLYGIDSNGDGVDDCAIYVNGKGESSERLCKNAKMMSTSADSSFLYYTDGKDTLRRIAIKDSLEDKVCGKKVKEFIVSDDARSVWYICDDGLYRFDGMLSDCLIKVNDIEAFTLTDFGYVVIETENELLIYDDEVEVVVGDKENVKAVGLSRFCCYYVDDYGLHIAREDGTFKTDAEAAAAENKSSDAQES